MSLGSFDLREPSLSQYVSGLQDANMRWAQESREIALSDEILHGSFDPMLSVEKHGRIAIAGEGDYAGWKICASADADPRKGWNLVAPPTSDDSIGATVGHVSMNRDGTWTACHDGFNHRPGTRIGCCGTKVVVPSAEAAYRDVVVRQTRHLAKYGR